MINSNKKILFLLLFIIFINLKTFPQAAERQANIDFNESYYEEALKRYLEIYKNEYENIKYNYRIGICYLFTNIDKSLAVPYLEFVANQDIKNKSIHYDLGIAYHYAQQYDKSIEAFEIFKRTLNRNSELFEEVNRYIEVCNNAIELKSKPLNIEFVNLGKNVNSKKSEYAPFVTEDGNSLLYTSDRKYVSIYKTYIKNVYYCRASLNGWKKTKPVTRINTVDDEILTGLSNAGDRLFVQIMRYDVYKDVYSCSKYKTRFGVIEDLGKNINSKYTEKSACLSTSGDTLYFSSNQPGGFGGMDIYYSLHLPDGSWGIPVNLGANINSEYDEDYPNISYDGKTLMFCSNGYNTMGGFDIFVSKMNLISKEWQKPKNFGYPVNDPYDNYTISIAPKGRIAYVSSLRKDGFGEFDIYKVVFKNKEAEISVRKGLILVGNPDTSFQTSMIDTNISITIIDKKTNNIFGRYNYNKTTGEYLFALPSGDYYINIEGENYEPYNKLIHIPNKHPAKNNAIVKNIYLKQKYN
ncbi:MAG: PD40 domain-containing protein [Bacteroidales bacterium]|nr:PD40 domain-containing protein [Bacteroidales bacterium]